MKGLRLAVVAAAAIASVGVARADLEEIVIKGRIERLAELRKAIDAAEDRAYTRYNELNTDDAYDIACKQRAPTGRRITARYCEPKYVGDAAHAEAATFTNVPNGTSSDVRFATARELHEAGLRGLQQRMRTIAAKDPQMRDALVERDRLTQAYQTLQQRK